VVNTAGDSVIAEFGSPVEAVRAATEIQDALRTRNESLPEPRRMRFRIGVNLGDVMIKGDDLLGDGVNVAARLQALAEPGGICISGSVFDQIEGKLSLRFQDAGEQTLKNISRPVRALHLRGGVPPEPGAAAAARPRRRSRRGVTTSVLAGAAVVVLAGVAYLTGLVPPGARDGRQEAAAWATAKSAGDVAALEGYLAAHPEGAHAGEARTKVAALLADARQAAEAARGATERARAEAELARQKAEADAARARAEAETTRLKAEADVAKARAEAARKNAEAPRTAVEPRRSPAPPAAAAPTGGRETRFDGLWVGEMSCPEWRGNSAMQRPQRAVVRNGEMIFDLPPGRPRAAPPAESRPTQVTARIQDDDSVELRFPAMGPGGRGLERVVKGRFVSDRFTGQVDPPARPCTLQLGRGPAAPGA
jgi:hypothetical protein